MDTEAVAEGNVISIREASRASAAAIAMEAAAEAVAAAATVAKEVEPSKARTHTMK